MSFGQHFYTVFIGNWSHGCLKSIVSLFKRFAIDSFRVRLSRLRDSRSWIVSPIRDTGHNLVFFTNRWTYWKKANRNWNIGHTRMRDFPGCKPWNISQLVERLQDAARQRFLGSAARAKGGARQYWNRWSFWGLVWFPFSYGCGCPLSPISINGGSTLPFIGITPLFLYAALVLYFCL